MSADSAIKCCGTLLFNKETIAINIYRGVQSLADQFGDSSNISEIRATSLSLFLTSQVLKSQT